jgi:hypothetical protein
VLDSCEKQSQKQLHRANFIPFEVSPREFSPMPLFYGRRIEEQQFDFSWAWHGNTRLLVKQDGLQSSRVKWLDRPREYEYRLGARKEY